MIFLRFVTSTACW